MFIINSMNFMLQDYKEKTDETLWFHPFLFIRNTTFALTIFSQHIQRLAEDNL